MGKVDDDDKEKMRCGNGGTMKPTTMRKGKGAEWGGTPKMGGGHGGHRRGAHPNKARGAEGAHPKKARGAMGGHSKEGGHIADDDADDPKREGGTLTSQSAPKKESALDRHQK